MYNKGAHTTQGYEEMYTEFFNSLCPSAILFFFFLINLFILLIYFWLRWVFLAACALSLVVASGGYSSLRCAGFSLQWLLLLQSTGSRCAGFSSCGTRALERRLSSCGARALLLRGMWEIPGPGLEPLSPALAGGFLTTVPPEKPPSAILVCLIPSQGFCHLFNYFFLFLLLVFFNHCWIAAQSASWLHAVFYKLGPFSPRGYGPRRKTLRMLYKTGFLTGL